MQHDRPAAPVPPVEPKVRAGPDEHAGAPSIGSFSLIRKAMLHQRNDLESCLHRDDCMESST